MSQIRATRETSYITTTISKRIKIPATNELSSLSPHSLTGFKSIPRTRSPAAGTFASSARKKSTARVSAANPDCNSTPERAGSPSGLRKNKITSSSSGQGSETIGLHQKRKKVPQDRSAALAIGFAPIKLL